MISKRALIALPMLFAFLLSISLSSRAAAGSSINLRKALGSGYVCTTARGSVQFLSEDKLLLLVGPTENCYQSTTQLQLILLSLNGNILARKSWPSTFPIIVLPDNRIVVSEGSRLDVLNDRLESVQIVPLPRPDHLSMPYLKKRGADKVEVTANGDTFLYGGLPLARIEASDADPPIQRGDALVYSFCDGRYLVNRANILLEIKGGAPPATVASLKWVIPCEKYCQEYEAGNAYQVVTGTTRRVLVMSNGSRFPITDAAGLFPYFRLVVIDLDSGAEIYREENIFKTAKRIVTISPDGDLLATSDGTTLIVRRLRK